MFNDRVVEDHWFSKETFTCTHKLLKHCLYRAKVIILMRKICLWSIQFFSEIEMKFFFNGTEMKYYQIIVKKYVSMKQKVCRSAKNKKSKPLQLLIRNKINF